MITEDTVPVVVRYCDPGPGDVLDAVCRKGHASRADWRKLQSYTVSVFRWQFQRYLNDGLIDQVIDGCTPGPRNMMKEPAYRSNLPILRSDCMKGGRSMDNSPPLHVKVWGELACFTRPEMKVERVSYPVMTRQPHAGCSSYLLETGVRVAYP